MGYLGSKTASGAYQAIIAVMPPHETFIDLFAGSGAILSRKGAAARSYAVDLDAAAVDALADSPGLVKLCGDALRFLDKFDYAAAGRVLIYADPPYTVRSASDWMEHLRISGYDAGRPSYRKALVELQGVGCSLASFAGVDFTDRQRIKRKAARWAAHYRALPAGERLAVLAALREVHHSDG